MCVCSLRYPASSAHAPCCHTRHARLYNIFTHYFINGMTFEKKTPQNIICVCLDFLYDFLILRMTERDTIEMYVGFHVKYKLFLSEFSEHEFSRLTFEKHTNIKFHKNPCFGSQVVPYGRTDRQTNMTRLIVAFRNFAIAPKNGCVCHIQ